jgi:hypothetical protein
MRRREAPRDYPHLRRVSPKEWSSERNSASERKVNVDELLPESIICASRSVQVDSWDLVYPGPLGDSERERQGVGRLFSVQMMTGRYRRPFLPNLL